MAALVVFLICLVILSGLIGAAIGVGKGRGMTGFWLGLLLGFIGWIIVAVMEPSAEVRLERAEEFLDLAAEFNEPTSRGHAHVPVHTAPSPFRPRQ